MPNHCSGYLEVEGDPKLLNKFMKQVEVCPSEANSNEPVTKFSLNKVIPMPKKLYEGEGWYDWRNANWGTKWDLCDLEAYDSDWEEGSVSYSFWTAWSPPEQVLEELTVQHPELSFTYTFSDEGGGFWGRWNFFNGMKDVVEEGSDLDLAHMSQDEKCRVRVEFFQQGSDHHTCRECGDYFVECKGNNFPETEYLCEKCQTSLESLEKTLWEDEDGTQRRDPNAKEGEGSCQQLSNF